MATLYFKASFLSSTFMMWYPKAVSARPISPCLWAAKNCKYWGAKGELDVVHPTLPPLYAAPGSSDNFKSSLNLAGFDFISANVLSAKAFASSLVLLEVDLSAPL